MGELAALDALDCTIVYRCDTRSYNRKFLQQLPSDVVIAFHGGGNLGDMWVRHQLLREEIIEHQQKKKILQLPQSVHFADTRNAETLKRLIGRHDDFHLLVRDERSRELAETLLTPSALVAPDAAFMIGAIRRPVEPTVDVLALLREDEESLLRLPLKARKLGLVTRDWVGGAENEPQALEKIEAKFLKASGYVRNASVLSRGLDVFETVVTRRLASGQVDRAVRILSSGQAVITDRLHAHILCELAGIPHAVIDSGHGKVSRFHEHWMTGLPNGQLFTTFEEAVEWSGQRPL